MTADGNRGILRDEFCNKFAKRKVIKYERDSETV